MSKSVPLVFNSPAYHGSIGEEHLCLAYGIAPLGKAQRRFAERLCAEPLIDLQDYEFRAVFDWIEIFVETEGVHSAVNLQRRLMRLNDRFGAFRKCFVTSPTRGKAHSGRGHIIKMQDPAPEGLSKLLRVFLCNDCVPGYALDEIPVTGMELSLDVYPAPRFGGAEMDYALRRMRMTELLRKHVAVDEVYRAGPRRPRFVYQKGVAKGTQFMVAARGSFATTLRKKARELGMDHRDLASCDAAHHHQPFIDSTMYFGKKGERLQYRLMDKITDNRTGETADKLPIRRTRSRVEFTFVDEEPGDRLGPAAIGIKNVEDLALDGLTSFNTWLRFELPTFEGDDLAPAAPDRMAWEIFSKTGVMGLAQRDDAVDVIGGDKDVLRAKARRRASSTDRRLAFSKLNGRVTKALRRLERRWRQDWSYWDK